MKPLTNLFQKKTDETTQNSEIKESNKAQPLIETKENVVEQNKTLESD